MISDQKNSLLIPPKDPTALAEACIALLNDPEKRNAMGKIGWEIADERFNILKQVQQLGTVYQELLTFYGK